MKIQKHALLIALLIANSSIVAMVALKQKQTQLTDNDLPRHIVDNRVRMMEQAAHLLSLASITPEAQTKYDGFCEKNNLLEAELQKQTGSHQPLRIQKDLSTRAKISYTNSFKTIVLDKMTNPTSASMQTLKDEWEREVTEHLERWGNRDEQIRVLAIASFQAKENAYDEKIDELKRAEAPLQEGFVDINLRRPPLLLHPSLRGKTN